jgi:23S rRNA pseudouridine1911/1915/1917 synthase
MRLDVYLATYYPEYSRSVWQKYIALGYVRVGEVVRTVAKTTLGEDDEVSFTIPEGPDFTGQQLPVLYEDNDVLVIDKPAGVLTHSKGALNDEFTVAEFGRPYTTFKHDTNRPGIIHRLDRDTSGVILLAKNDEAATYVQRQFSQRTVKKTYIAVTVGIPKEPSAVIDAPIARNPKAPSTFRVDPKGKSAMTRYEVLATDKAHALVRLNPKTGRTHQLRVHLAYINAPILGDRVYGKAADRLYLHAQSLEVTLPGGKRTVLTSQVPLEFTERFNVTL